LSFVKSINPLIVPYCFLFLHLQILTEIYAERVQ
jgi:hypothetical protein